MAGIRGRAALRLRRWLRLRNEHLQKKDESEERDRKRPSHGASFWEVRPVYTRDSAGRNMPRRRNLDLEKLRASLDVACPHCGVRIAPENQLRVDWDQLQCPSCGKRFVPKSEKP